MFPRQSLGAKLSIKKEKLGGKLIAVNVYIKKKKKKKKKDRKSSHLKLLEKEEQAKHKAGRRKEVKKIQAETNLIEKRKKAMNAEIGSLIRLMEFTNPLPN